MCSLVELLAAKGIRVAARTMDFSDKAGENQFTWIAGDNLYRRNGVDTRFTAIGSGKAICDTLPLEIAGFPVNMICEGLNDDGLMFSLLYNLDNTVGKDESIANPKLPVKLNSIMLVPALTLARCKTVKDVRNVFENDLEYPLIVPKVLDIDFSHMATIHFYFSDSAGDILIIEFHGGMPNVYTTLKDSGVERFPAMKDPMGNQIIPLPCLANAPEYAFHMTNLRNFLNVNASGVDSLDFGNQTFIMTSHGNGTSQLSGGEDSPCRFVRLAYMQNMVRQYGEQLDEVSGMAKAALLVGLASVLLGTNKEGKKEGVSRWTAIKSAKAVAGGKFDIQLRRKMRDKIDYTTV